MPARRCSLAEHALLCALLLSTGCEERPPRPERAPPPPASARPAASAAAIVDHTVAAIDRAAAAAERFERGRARADYLALRRAVASAAPMLRLRAPLGTEVLLGPPSAGEEGAGALGALDAAGSRAQASRPLEQVRRSLRLVRSEVRLHGVPAAQALQALSDACYELGLLLLEASGSVPFEPDAVLADLRGTLEGIAGGARALAASHQGDKAVASALGLSLSIVAELERALSGAKSSHALVDRAELVAQSGKLGIALRRLGKALGERVELPYLARQPFARNALDEPVTPFTLPAPRPDARGGDQAQMAALGRKLFFDRRLSRDARRACADCHQPSKAFSDGRIAPASLDPAHPLVRNTPSLLYAPLHAAQLWDGEFASAERQALKVIHTAAEMGLTADELTDIVRGVPEYQEGFARVFEDGVTESNVARALVAFEVRELVPGTAPIDRFARGEHEALSPRARAGLDVFAGKGRCARCHVPPSFAGSRPRDFAVPVLAALGVPAAPGARELDGDPGRARITGRPLDQGVFKTPTVRNVALTAPYFHHGRFPTLEEVVEFYDEGGGKGAGVRLDHQDPDVRPLELTEREKRDLLLFLREALADDAGT